MSRGNELNEEAVVAYYEELRHTDKDDSNKPKPICKKLSLTDTTPEAIYKALSFMPQMVYRDEIKGMIDDFDRYKCSPSGIVPVSASTARLKTQPSSESHSWTYLVAFNQGS